MGTDSGGGGGGGDLPCVEGEPPLLLEEREELPSEGKEPPQELACGARQVRHRQRGARAQANLTASTLDLRGSKAQKSHMWGAPKTTERCLAFLFM